MELFLGKSKKRRWAGREAPRLFYFLCYDMLSENLLLEH